jgi:anti-sigma regulatory factor (Ser/Thr protein kinase)
MPKLRRIETIQFKIPADPKYVSAIRRAVQAVARNLNFPDDSVDDIGISVDEALSNAVKYGSPERGCNAVAVNCKVGDGALTIEVRDEGPGFGPPGSGEQDVFEEHGRGLKLIYRLMDSVHIDRMSKGSRIRMVKSMHAPPKKALRKKAAAKP